MMADSVFSHLERPDTERNIRKNNSKRESQVSGAGLSSILSNNGINTNLIKKHWDETDLSLPDTPSN